MELTHKIDTPEQANMLDPFNEKKSMLLLKQRIQLMDIYDLGSLYPQEMMEEIESKVEA